MIQKGGSLGDFFKTISRKVINPVYKEVISPVYKGVLKPVVKEVKPFVNPVLKEAKGIGTAVGVDLAGALLEDAITGKSSKASAKARGQQASLNAKNMATARVLQALAQNGNGFPKTDPLIALDNSIEEKPPPKRKRAQPTGLPPAKRKKVEPKKQPSKRKRVQKRGSKTQTGGFGGAFRGLFDGMQKLERAALKPLTKRAMRDKRKSKKRKGKKRKGKKRTQKGGRKKGKKKSTLGSVVRESYKELWP